MEKFINGVANDVADEILNEINQKKEILRDH